MKMLRSKKALSPVVASIILIAVTVAVSIAVAAWMGALTFTFMGTEEVKVISHQWDSATNITYINLKVTNVGTAKVTLSSAEINNAPATSNITSTIVDPGSYVWVQVTHSFAVGIKYDFNIVTAKGTKSPYTATAPS
jgi:flagellin-like protein